jgi:cytochrome c5
MKIFSLFILLSLCLPALAADKVAYIVPDDTALKTGRTIWIDNCEGCHGYGIADAPIPMQPDDWANRVGKGRTLLYRHAIEGFIGEDYSAMPARGGNEELNDNEVKAAVDYMLFLAEFYLKKEGEL